MNQAARLVVLLCNGRWAIFPATVATLLGLLFVRPSFAQSGAVIPQGGAGHAPQASCVILKRMGPADQVTSRLYSFGIRGKQFQYVEGKLPDGFPFHGRLTDHDVRNLQARGAEVIVVNQNFTSDDLRQARDDCRGETGKTPIQADAKAAPSQAQAGTTHPSASATVPAETHLVAAPATAAQAQLQVTSTPDGADIEIDGGFVGNTPSTMGVAPGQHQLLVKKTGFKPWERKITVSSGQVNVNAALDPEAK
jgi:hypothetical protein